jgi:N-acetylglucosaminyl-diphospho-decaprenol L-rhamnosyltransferase
VEPSLGVVIVNFRTAGLVIECLRSLEPEVMALPGTRVIVVDNASGDGSQDRIATAIEAEGWSGWATLLPLPDNRGFAAGNNAGIRLFSRDATPPDLFLLLNPDTLVREGALQALLRRAAAEPRAGVIGSRLVDPDGAPQVSTFRFHTVSSQFIEALSLGLISRLLKRRSLVMPVSEAACRVEWVSGASMLVRRQAFEELGGMDEGYFLYYEEVDYCLRAMRAGWECHYEPGSQVVHLVGKSTGVDPSVTVRRLPGYVLESRRRYFVKNHGRLYAMLADLAWLAGHLAWRLRMRLQGRKGIVAAGVLADFIRHGAFARWRSP